MMLLLPVVLLTMMFLLSPMLEPVMTTSNSLQRQQQQPVYRRNCNKSLTKERQHNTQHVEYRIKREQAPVVVGRVTDDASATARVGGGCWLLMGGGGGSSSSFDGSFVPDVHVGSCRGGGAGWR